MTKSNRIEYLEEPCLCKKNIFYTEDKSKQEKRSISHGGYEKKKLFDMESALIDHYGYNYSQPVKSLIRKNYYEIKAVLQE